MLRKSLLFCAVSYLVARLAVVLEISRLALLRWRPRARVVQLARYERTVDQGMWLFLKDRDYYLGMSSSQQAPIVVELPPRSVN